VTILRNNGSGKFTQPASSPMAAGDAPYGIVTAELDGDGDQDLAITNYNDDNVMILRNNGKFTVSSLVAVGDGPTGVVAADLDGDDDQDLAVANSGSDNVTIFFNNGSGKFTVLPDSGSAALQALGRPECFHIVINLEGGNALRHLDPGQFRAREDVDIRRK
jgi:hypothetical protein